MYIVHVFPLDAGVKQLLDLLLLSAKSSEPGEFFSKLPSSYANTKAFWICTKYLATKCYIPLVHNAKPLLVILTGFFFFPLQKNFGFQLTTVERYNLALEHFRSWSVPARSEGGPMYHVRG